MSGMSRDLENRSFAEPMFVYKKKYYMFNIKGKATEEWPTEWWINIRHVSVCSLVPWTLSSHPLNNCQVVPCSKLSPITWLFLSWLTWQHPSIYLVILQQYTTSSATKDIGFKTITWFQTSPQMQYVSKHVPRHTLNLNAVALIQGSTDKSSSLCLNLFELQSKLNLWIFLAST